MPSLCFHTQSQVVNASQLPSLRSIAPPTAPPNAEAKPIMLLEKNLLGRTVVQNLLEKNLLGRTVVENLLGRTVLGRTVVAEHGPVVYWWVLEHGPVVHWWVLELVAEYGPAKFSWGAWPPAHGSSSLPAAWHTHNADTARADTVQTLIHTQGATKKWYIRSSLNRFKLSVAACFRFLMSDMVKSWSGMSTARSWNARCHLQAASVLCRCTPNAATCTGYVEHCIGHNTWVHSNLDHFRHVEYVPKDAGVIELF